MTENENDEYVEKEIKGFGDVSGYYVRDTKKIKISFSGEAVNYVAVIYKNGTFDYKYSNIFSGDKIAKEGLNNTLSDKYNYDTIKNFVEIKKKSKLKISDFLYRIVHELSKVAGVDAVFDWIVNLIFYLFFDLFWNNAFASL